MHFLCADARLLVPKQLKLHAAMLVAQAWRRLRTSRPNLTCELYDYKTCDCWLAGYVLDVWILCPSHCDRQGTPGEPAGPPQRPLRHQRLQLCHQVHPLLLDSYY